MRIRPLAMHVYQEQIADQYGAKELEIGDKEREYHLRILAASLRKIARDCTRCGLSLEDVAEESLK